MPSKKINQLETRVLSATDLMLVGDPSTGVSFKSLISGLGSVYVPNSTTITINGTTLNLTTNRSWSVGSVTSVNMSVPTGLTISGNPITNAGTLALGLASGYTIPTQALLDGKVPYIGATGNVDLGEYELKAGQLTLDISPTGTAAVGTTRWNNTIGSSETTLKGGSVILKNGVDLVARVVNKVSPNTTLTKAAYQAVRVTGAQGQRLAVAYAQANNDNNSADTIGLVCETIATNQEGFIITVGQIENINTTGSLQGETWVDGDVLYLSPTTPGAITNVKPVAPQHLVVIGYVEYAHANNGKIYVKVMNGWELGELHDVNTTGAVNGNVLKYNGSIWVPSSDIDTGITSLNGLTALSQTFATGTSGTDFGISSSSSIHTFNIPSASATNRGALTSADWTTFNNKQSAGNYITALTGEVTASGPGSASATLLNSAVTGKVLTGLNLIGGGTISATDTILQAFGKTQNQISALVGGVMYEGVWNASTNTPTIVSSIGAKGDYYVVNVAGSTNIDGINDWKIGDWIIFNGTNWNKVDNTDAVSSVNGFTGAVSLTTANISEVTNLYFTDQRVMSAMLTGYTIGSNTAITFNDSVLTAFGKAQAQINTKQNIVTLTTTGSSGSATFVSDTLNVPTYTLAGLGGQPQLNGTGFVKISGTTISYDNTSYLPLTGGTLSSASSAETLRLVNTGTGYGLYNQSDSYFQGDVKFQSVSNTILKVDSSNKLIAAVAGTDYQAPITNPVTGTGTTNYLPKWTSGSAIGNSLIYDSGTAIGIGTTSVTANTVLDVSTTGTRGYIIAQSTSVSAGSEGGLRVKTNTKDYYIFTDNTSDALRFYDGTASAERMRLTSSGNLLLNSTTDNGNRLQITGTASFTGNVTSNVQFISNNGTVETRLSYSSTPAGVVGTISNHPLELYTNGNAKATLTPSGNLGLGVQPSAWSGLTAMQINQANFRGSSGVLGLSHNAFYNGTNFIYQINTQASDYYQINGQHIWNTAPSGTAGNAITFTQAMTLTSNGNLLLNTTTDSGERLVVNGSANVNGLFVISNSTGIPAQTSSLLRFASGFASPDIGRMYIGDGTGWKFHMSKRISSTTTDLITFFDTGAATFSSSVTANGGMIVNGYSTASSGLNVEFGIISGYTQFNSYNRTTSSFAGMRIDGSYISINSGSGGNLLVGTTTDNGSKLQVNGDITTGAASTIRSTSDYLVVQAATNLVLNGNTGSVNIRTNNSDKLVIANSGAATFSNKINFTPIATPSSPSAGDVYYDSTSNKLRCYNGTSWNDLF